MNNFAKQQSLKMLSMYSNLELPKNQEEVTHIEKSEQNTDIEVTNEILDNENELNKSIDVLFEPFSLQEIQKSDNIETLVPHKEDDETEGFEELEDLVEDFDEDNDVEKSEISIYLDNVENSLTKGEDILEDNYLNSFEKSQSSKILAMYNSHENDIEKAKATPEGGLSKDGKYKKQGGEWVRIKKEKQNQDTSEVSNTKKITEEAASYEELGSKTIFYKEDGSWLTTINNDSLDLDSAKKIVDNNSKKLVKQDDIYSDLTPEQRSKVKEAKPSENIGTADVVITFANQKLLNLWENEMQGQISDGMWENSRNTEWLWKSVSTKLGNETKVEFSKPYMSPGKTSFPFNKDLKEIVGERATEEAGFKDLSETSKAWKEINDAIKTPKVSSELVNNRAKISENNKKIFLKNVEIVKEKLKGLGFDIQYDFASHKKLSNDTRVTVNPKSVTSKNGKGYVSVEISNYKYGGLPKLTATIRLKNLEEYINTTENYYNTIIDLNK